MIVVRHLSYRRNVNQHYNIIIPTKIKKKKIQDYIIFE